MQVVTDHPTKVLRVADAKEAFGYDQIDDLEDYFVVLAAGDIAVMTTIFERYLVHAALHFARVAAIAAARIHRA